MNTGHPKYVCTLTEVRIVNNVIIFCLKHQVFSSVQCNKMISHNQCTASGGNDIVYLCQWCTYCSKHDTLIRCHLQGECVLVCKEPCNTYV